MARVVRKAWNVVMAGLDRYNGLYYFNLFSGVGIPPGPPVPIPPGLAPVPPFSFHGVVCPSAWPGDHKTNTTVLVDGDPIVSRQHEPKHDVHIPPGGNLLVPITIETAASLGGDFADASRFTYPRNARGLGYFVAVDPARMVGASLPNIEDIDDPLLPERMFCPSPERWIDQPMPGSLDWVAPSDFPRCLHFNILPDFALPERPVREIALGALSDGDLAPKDLLSPPSVRAANGAPPGLARVRLSGGEAVLLTNLHPQRSELSFHLPQERPELAVQPPGCPVLPLEAALDTVYLEPDRERLSLVWSGSLRVAGRYPPEELAQVGHTVKWP